MARSKITSTSKDLITDDGSVLASLIEGEQTRMAITLNWLTNLTGYTITCKVVEGENVQGAGTIPTQPLTGGIKTDLPIIDIDVTDNTFEIVFPETLIDSWSTSPEPDKPIYGYIGLEVRDTGIGNLQQVWKPMRGLIQVRYAPTEEV